MSIYRPNVIAKVYANKVIGIYENKFMGEVVSYYHVSLAGSPSNSEAALSMFSRWLDAGKSELVGIKLAGVDTLWQKNGYNASDYRPQ